MYTPAYPIGLDMFIRCSQQMTGRISKLHYHEHAFSQQLNTSYPKQSRSFPMKFIKLAKAR